MFRRPNEKFVVILVLMAVILFHLVNNAVWLSLDRQPRGHDTVWHLVACYDVQLFIRQVFNKHLSLFQEISQILNRFINFPLLSWPPLMYFIVAITNLTHLSVFFIRFYINSFFYILLIISTYFLGKYHFNRNTGLFAAIFISLYPAVYGYARQFETDFPLLAIVAASLCLLCYNEYFFKRGIALSFGVCLGLATLIKFQVVFFIFFHINL